MTTTCIAPEPSLTGYKFHRCRCTGCCKASTDYSNRRYRLIAYHRWQPFIDAAPVQQHVRALMEFGIGWQRVARLAGVGTTTVSNLLYGRKGCPPTRRIRPHIGAALLAVQPEIGALSDKSMIDGTGTRRRVQALVAAGWSIKDQADRLGRCQRNHGHTFRQERVLVCTYRQIRRLYEELSPIPAPAGYAATRAKAMAARNGWLPPLAWDDDIDDPSAQPYAATDADSFVDDVAVARALRGERIRLTRLERHHAVHRGVAAGMALQRIADALHLSYHTTFTLSHEPLPADNYELAA